MQRKFSLRYPTCRAQFLINQLGVQVGNLISMTLVFLVSYSMSFFLSWKLSLSICSVIPLVFVIVFSISGSREKAAKANRENFEKAGGIAEEVLYNYKTTASFANFDYERKRFKDRINEAYEAGVTISWRVGLNNAVIYFFVFGSFAIAFLVGGYLLSIKETKINGDPLTVANILQCAFLLFMGTIVFGSGLPFISRIKSAKEAASDFFNLIERKPVKSAGNLLVELKEGKIEMKKVNFSYNNSSMAVENIDFIIESHKTTAIVGLSGSGKSTIVSLITGLYEPESGEVLVDGVNINDFCIKNYRSQIGYVPQEPVLFDATIRENVLFGREATDEEIDVALEKSFSNEFVDRLENGKDYVVGVGGGKLSGGQRQRIAIARAILKNPQILLFDEATSALDSKSESNILKAIENLGQGRTVVLIAHRLSTIKNAHKIVVLRDSKVVEQGSHKELMTKNGLFAEMVNKYADSNIEQGEEETDDRNDSICEIKENVKEDENKGDYFAENKSKVKQYIKSSKLQIFFAALGSLLNGIVFPIMGYIFMSSVGKLMAIKDNYDGYFSTGQTAALYLLAVAALSFIAGFTQDFNFSKIGEKLCQTVRNEVFSKYLDLSLDFYEKDGNSPGSLITRLSTDSASINGIAFSYIGLFVQAIVSVLIGLAVAFYTSWKIAFVVLAVIPLFLLMGFMQSRAYGKILSAMNRTDEAAGEQLSQLVKNTKVVFVYNFQEKALELYAKKADAMGDSLLRSSLLNGFFFGCSNLLRMFFYGIVFYVGGKLVESNSVEPDELFSTLFTLVFSVFGLFNSFIHIGDHEKTKKAFTSVFQTLDEQPSIPINDTTAKNLIDFKGHIEFKNVTFSYPSLPNVAVLRNVSFEIKPGEKVALVGQSGCGKSTVVNLIERFFDVTEGTILLDGCDIKSYNLTSLRQAISVVFQEPVLFKKNVRENIRYGRLDASDEEVDEAAKVAFIDKVLQNNNDQIAMISGGEKQRVAIARALLKKAPLVLLDEATSALDQNSEQVVQRALDNLTEQKTTLVIAHRLSTVVNSDKILVMEKGKIVEQGTHTSLMNAKGKYYKLYNVKTA